MIVPKGIRHCIIHVGMHKTGTSSIQQSLMGFRDSDFVYADIDGRPNHTPALVSVFVESNGEYFLNVDRRNKNLGKRDVKVNTLRQLNRSILEVNGQTYIISGEGIAVFSKEELINMRNYLRIYFDKISIVAAIRSPASYMESAFQERSKKELSEFIKYREYMSFQKFDDVFGKDNVNFWKFNPIAYPNGCAVQDFCKRLGVNLPAERIVRVNESLSREAVSLLFTYRKFGDDLGARSMTGPQRKQLVESVASLGGNNKFHFSPDVIKPILEKNRSDIEWMEERLGESLYEELGEYRPGDVRDESDLLKPDPAIVSNLLSLLGDSAPKGVKGEAPEEVALLVHALRDDSANQEKKPRQKTTGLNRGKIVRAESGIVAGWAIGDDYENPVRVALLVNGEEVAQMLANKMRKGVMERGIHPSGCCGFVFRFNSKNRLKLSDKVKVVPVDDGCTIGSLFVEINTIGNK